MAKFPAPLTYFKQSVVFRCPATYENCAAGGDSGARRGQFLCDIDTRDPYTVLVYGIDVEAIQPLLSFLRSVRTVPWVPEIGTVRLSGARNQITCASFIRSCLLGRGLECLLSCPCKSA
jgi:hypothetical protein